MILIHELFCKPLDENIETIYEIQSFSSYSITIITYETKDIVLTENQIVLTKRFVKSAQTFANVLASENLFTQTMKKTRQKELVMEAQQLIISVQQSLEFTANASVVTENETESTFIMAFIDSYKSSLESLGIMM